MTQTHSIVVGLGAVVGVATIVRSGAVLALGLAAFVAVKTVTDLRRADAEERWRSGLEPSDAAAELSDDDLLAADSTAPPAYPRRVFVAVGCAILLPVAGYLAAGWTVSTLVALYAAELSFVWVVLHFLVGVYYPEPSSEWFPDWLVRAVQFVCFAPFAAVALAVTLGLPLFALLALDALPRAGQYPSLGAAIAAVAGTYCLALLDGTDAVDEPRVDAVTTALKDLSGTLARGLLPVLVVAVCLVAVDAPAAAVLPLVAFRAVFEGFRYQWGRLEGEGAAADESIAPEAEAPSG